MSPAVRAASVLLVWAATSGASAQAAAQGSNPLRKTDVVRLLASPMIGRGEIAALIRRNCLAFRPTARDWADFRNLGADAEILGSVDTCAERATHAGQRAAPRVIPVASPVTIAAGADALIPVLLKRGALVEAGVMLALHGAPGEGAESRAVTDADGMAQFRLPAVRAAGAYRLQVTRTGAAPSPKDPTIELLVRPGPPAAADVVPGKVPLDAAPGAPNTVTVVIRDAFGNLVRGETVELRGADPEMGVAAGAATTDSVGAATFVLEPHAIARPGRIDVLVRGNALGALQAGFARAASETASRFVTGAGQAGIAGMQLNGPVVFQARDSSGRPLAGRLVSFTAQNAVVTPARATTDGAGLAQIQVTLGATAGVASVTASVDSVRKQATLRIQPAAATEVIIEHNGVRVDGGRLVVAPETPFVLHVSGRDPHGNVVPTAGLARALATMRAEFNAHSSLLRMERVEADGAVTTVTFKPLGRGTAPLTIAEATVTVEVAGPR